MTRAQHGNGLGAERSFSGPTAVRLAVAEQPALPEGTVVRGNQTLLQKRSIALFCSARCPGEVILRAYDFVSKFDAQDTAVVGGFHTPLEKECLRLLLRKGQPVIICPARSVERMRLPAVWTGPLVEGRLLVASPFADGENRVTGDKANRRNYFVASLADEVLVIYAAPGSKTLTLCREAIASQKPLLTLDSTHNKDLIALGAEVIEEGHLRLR